MSCAICLKKNNVNTVKDIQNLTQAQIERMSKGLSSEGQNHMQLFVQAAETQRKYPGQIMFGTAVQALCSDGTIVSAETKVEHIVKFTLLRCNLEEYLAKNSPVPPPKTTAGREKTKAQQEEGKLRESTEKGFSALWREGFINGVSSMSMDFDEHIMILSLSEKTSDALLENYAYEIRARCAGLDSFKIVGEYMGHAVELSEVRRCRCTIMELIFKVLQHYIFLGYHDCIFLAEI